VLLGAANTGEKLPRVTLKLPTLGVFTPGRFPEPVLAYCAGGLKLDVGLVAGTPVYALVVTLPPPPTAKSTLPFLGGFARDGAATPGVSAQLLEP